jgi:hypothetical protein
VDQSTRKIVSAALGTASMVAFAVPVPPWSEIAGVVLGLADTLFEAFTGDPPAPNPAITRSELKEAVDGVRDQINDSLWRTEVDRITFEVLALYQGFYDAYAFVSRVPLDKDKLVFPTNNDTVKHLIQRMDDYFDMTIAQDTDGILTTLRKHRYLLELKGGVMGTTTPTTQQIQDHQLLSMAAYTSIGSLTVAYLKTAMLWNWGKEMLAAGQYENFQRDLKDWQNDPANHPDPRPHYPSNIQQMNHRPAWEEWTMEDNPVPPPARKKADNCCANILIEEVQEILDYQTGTAPLQGSYTKVRAHLDAMDAAVFAGVNQLTVGASPTSAQVKQAAKLGGAAATLLEVTTDTYGLALMDPEAVVGLGQAMDLWRSAQASVMFQTLTVKATDPHRTLTLIAGDAYPNENAAAYAQKLYDANPGLFPDPQPQDPLNANLPNQTGLKIFQKEAYPYLTVADGGVNP